MARTSWVPPTLNSEGAASGKATSSELRFATQQEYTLTGPGLQSHGEARHG